MSDDAVGGESAPYKSVLHNSAGAARTRLEPTISLSEVSETVCASNLESNAVNFSVLCLFHSQCFCIYLFRGKVRSHESWNALKTDFTKYRIKNLL
jgi:hypothetical protein